MNYCNLCLDEAILDTPNGVANEVDLSTVERSEKVCVRCGHPFCERHASPVDQTSQCLGCLPLEAIDEKVEPLKGDDGVVHRGRQITPTGIHYRTLPKAISQLTDEELEKFITDTSKLIHDTEKIQDYRRVGLSTARLEKNDRADVTARQLRALNASMPRTQRVTITGKKGNGVSTDLNLIDFIKFAKEQLAKRASVNTAPKVTGATPPSTGAAGPSAPPLIRVEAPVYEKEIEDILEGGKNEKVCENTHVVSEKPTEENKHG